MIFFRFELHLRLGSSHPDRQRIHPTTPGGARAIQSRWITKWKTTRGRIILSREFPKAPPNLSDKRSTGTARSGNDLFIQTNRALERRRALGTANSAYNVRRADYSWRLCCKYWTALSNTSSLPARIPASVGRTSTSGCRPSRWSWRPSACQTPWPLKRT